MIKKSVSILSLLGIAVLGSNIAHAQVIKIDGSSTVYPITEAVAEDFQKAKKNAVKVTVGISGTGGGFKKFCRDELDISDASRPITKSEMELCNAAGVQ
jgi:phosphate transport system substrate-binding protein